MQLKKINKIKDKIKCPKCKTTMINLIEIAEARIIWIQNGTGMLLDGGYKTGDITKVLAECNNCGHNWTIRNKTTIMSIYPDFMERSNKSTT